MKLKKGDYIVTFSLVILSLLIAFLSGAFKEKVRGDTLVVELNGEIYAKYPLSEEKVFEIKTKEGWYNKIEIKSGYADMIESNCNDQICVNMKPIKDEGETIICLPHKMLLRVESEKDGKLDTVIY
ncbi:MAG: NusG domain II-containing protein [Peptoniphilaceae bacterium]|nr:NusG domain II-containing protein [Peptoniphilaceae bacterium]MDD7383326.1 NusG domain II-containing protein [Peptoniphilaceae bacterium]MDY3738303.1 NusG domain II-containing protein [Peptoniphilaceae bacterium]